MPVFYFLYSRIPYIPFMWKICCLKIKINPLSSLTSSQNSTKINLNACGKQKKYGLNTAYRLSMACRAGCQGLPTFVVRRGSQKLRAYVWPARVNTNSVSFSVCVCVCVMLERILVRILTVKQCHLSHAHIFHYLKQNGIRLLTEH